MCYSISITDVDDNNNTKTITTFLNVLLRKTVDLGKNTYLGLTDQGILAVVWLQNDGTIACVMQKHASRFKDIAVDNSVKTEKGFKPHIACLTVDGELFVGDLLSFTQPMLFLLKQIPNHGDAFRLFYDQGKCGVLYKKKEGIYSDFLIWPSNLEFYCLKKSLQDK